MIMLKPSNILHRYIFFLKVLVCCWNRTTWTNPSKNVSSISIENSSTKGTTPTLGSPCHFCSYFPMLPIPFLPRIIICYQNSIKPPFYRGSLFATRILSRSDYGLLIVYRLLYVVCLNLKLFGSVAFQVLYPIRPHFRLLSYGTIKIQ